MPIDTNEVRDKAINVPRHFAKITSVVERSTTIRDVVVSEELAAENDIVVYEFELEVNPYKTFTRQYGALKIELFTDIPDPNEFVERRSEEALGLVNFGFGTGGLPRYDLVLDSRTRQGIALEYQRLLESKRFGGSIRMITDIYSRATPPITPNDFMTGFIVSETTPFDNAIEFTAPTDPLSEIPTPPGLNNSNLPNPSLYDPTIPVANSSDVSNEVTSLKILRKAGLDPAMVGDKFGTPSLVGLNSLEASAVSSILYTAPTTARPKVVYAYRTPYQKLRVVIPIQKKILDGLETFMLRASFLKAKNGGESDERVDVLVKHSTLLDNFVTPTIPPTLHADYQPNQTVRVSLNQNDDKGRRIAVFRRKSTGSNLDVNPGTGWTKVFDRDVSTYDDVSFIDQLSTDKYLIYRALTYGQNGRPCEDFGHDVVAPSPLVPPAAPDGMTALAEFRSGGRNPGVFIDVINIPNGISTVMLRRYDVTFDSYEEKMLQTGKGFKYIKDSTGQTNAIVLGAPAHTFVDDSAVLGRSYRYVPVGVSSSPNIYGTESLIKLPYQNRTAPVSIIMSSPIISDPARNPDLVTFTIQADFTDFGFREIRNTLAAVGAQDLYDEQFRKNRSGFSSLISFLVERTNLTTGLVESFGIVEAGEFRDDFKNRQRFGVMPPQEGVQYNYSAQAIVGNADAMFPDINERTKDPTTLTVFNQALSKFRGGVASTIGTLPSTARQFDFNVVDIGNPTDPRLEGLTTVKETRTLIVQTRPVQLSVKSTVQFYHDHALISWSYDGNRRDTDHFRLSILSGGGSIVVDTIHCDPEVTDYSYRHFGALDNPGSRYSRPYRYEVVPVKIDYSLGTPDTTSDQMPVLVTPAGPFNTVGVQNSARGPRNLYGKPSDTDLINISRD